MTKPNDPRRAIWDKKYRETHKEEIQEYRKKNGAWLEANRDDQKRKASRQRTYEKHKAKWVEIRRAKRAANRTTVEEWWAGVLARIEDIANRNK